MLQVPFMIVNICSPRCHCVLFMHGNYGDVGGMKCVFTMTKRTCQRPTAHYTSPLGSWPHFLTGQHRGHVNLVRWLGIGRDWDSPERCTLAVQVSSSLCTDASARVHPSACPLPRAQPYSCLRMNELSCHSTLYIF